MAKKRGRPRSAVSLDSLVAELRQLDAHRVALVRRFQQATERVLKATGDKRPAPIRGAGPRTAEAAPKKKRTMSAAARRAISRAQKARWAKQKKAQSAQAK